MGYTILIGNAELEADFHDQDYESPRAEWVVRPLALDESPRSSDPTSGTNERWPSYSAWADFAREVGLYEWLLGKEGGKMAHHPGCARLTSADVALVSAALAKFRMRHPQAEATFCSCHACDSFARHEGGPDSDHNPNASGALVRLTWLEWWVRWAVANCERPAIYNT